MLLGCIPAHALYFSLYESIKMRAAAHTTASDAVGASVAVAVATVGHDMVMTPMDVIKQRMQLDMHRSLIRCARHICRHEGVGALYRSFGVTLLMNMPYAAVMGFTNEMLRGRLCPDGTYSLRTFLVAGAGAGVVAAAVTTPLDVVKTRLQTQGHEVGCGLNHVGRRPSPAPGALGTLSSAWPAAPRKLPYTQWAGHSQGRFAPLGGHMPGRRVQGLPAAAVHMAADTPVYSSFSQTVLRILEEEGWRGLCRGLGPRMVYHAPSVAISWVSRGVELPFAPGEAVRRR